MNAHFLLEEGIEILQRSRTRPACSMKVHGYVLVYHHTFCVSKCAGLSFPCSLIKTRVYKLQNSKTPWKMSIWLLQHILSLMKSHNNLCGTNHKFQNCYSDICLLAKNRNLHFGLFLTQILLSRFVVDSAVMLCFMLSGYEGSYAINSLKNAHVRRTVNLTATRRWRFIWVTGAFLWRLYESK